jgi:hypothetical protein
MDFHEKYGFYTSQTAIKDFEKEHTCPLRWKSYWLDKEWDFVTSLPMEQGLYFEQQVIGSSANEDEGEAILPKNKDGSKKVAHTRIDEQAEYCKEVLFNKDFKDYIGNHIGCNVEWRSFQEVIIFKNKRIVIDMLGTCEEGIVMGDLKLTADVNNVFGGAYTWGKISNMDLFQQGFYQMIYEQSTGEKVAKNILVVFDHSPKKGKKIINLTLTDNARRTIIARTKAFESAIEYYEKNTWPTIPSVDECAGCKLSHCNKRMIEEPVVSESVDL